MAAAPAITVPMNLSKETKGSFRYAAADNAAPIRDVYSASRPGPAKPRPGSPSNPDRPLTGPTAAGRPEMPDRFRPAGRRQTRNHRPGGALSKLYGRPRSFLTYDETLALSQLQQAFPTAARAGICPSRAAPATFTRPAPRSSCSGKPTVSRSSRRT